MDDEELLYHEMNIEDPYYMGQRTYKPKHIKRQSPTYRPVSNNNKYSGDAKQIIKGMLIGFCISIPIVALVLLLLILLGPK